jgi:hypothetical protein
MKNARKILKERQRVPDRTCLRTAQKITGRKVLLRCGGELKVREVSEGQFRAWIHGERRIRRRRAHSDLMVSRFERGKCREG